MYLAENHYQQNNIALRWSAPLAESLSYRHLAPTGQSTQNDYRCTSKLNPSFHLLVLIHSNL